MTEKKKVILHIGLPKTATTTLQDCLFLNLHKEGKVNYFGRITPKGNIDKIEAGVFEKRNEILNYLLGETSKRPDINTTGGMLNVYSDEQVSSPDIVFDNSSISNYHLSLLPSRLRELFPQQEYEYTIIIALRNQQSFVQSIFTQIIPSIQKGNYKLDDFLTEVLDGKQTIFNYEYVASLFASEFGIENTRILFFEDLLKDSDIYYDTWSSILGISASEVKDKLEGKQLNVKDKVEGGKVVAGYCGGTIARFITKRKRNPHVKRVLNNKLWKGSWMQQQFVRLIKPERKFFVRDLRPEEKKEIYNFFKDSNKNLVNYKVDEAKLRKYNYI